MPRLELFFDFGDLSGPRGNAFDILARTRRLMKKAGVDSDLIQEFTDEAMKGDYEHLLETVEDWFVTE